MNSLRKPRKNTYHTDYHDVRIAERTSMISSAGSKRAGGVRSQRGLAAGRHRGVAVPTDGRGAPARTGPCRHGHARRVPLPRSRRHDSGDGAAALAERRPVGAQPSPRTGLTERLRRACNRSAVRRSRYGHGAGQPDAGVVDGQHRSMSLCREGARTGSARCSTVLARLPQLRIPVGLNAYAGVRAYGRASGGRPGRPGGGPRRARPAQRPGGPRRRPASSRRSSPTRRRGSRGVRRGGRRWR